MMMMTNYAPMIWNSAVYKRPAATLDTPRNDGVTNVAPEWSQKMSVAGLSCDDELLSIFHKSLYRYSGKAYQRQSLF
jgi:hypothetical protein